MSNQNGDITIQAPIWVKMILQLGFPTSVACLLLAALLGWLPSPMMTTLNRLEYQAWQQTMLMRVICYSMVAGKANRECEPWKPNP